MEHNKLAFIITAYNEAITISNVVMNCKKFGDVFVIDDCSTDNTLDIIKNLNIAYIQNNINLGYEISLFKCLEYVHKKYDYDFFITVDADNQFDLNTINTAVKQIKKNKIFISSVRDVKNRNIEIITEKIFNLFFNIRDPLSGLKIYSKELVNQIDNKKFSGLLGMNYILYCLIKNLNIRQFDIQVQKRKGNSTFGGIFKSNVYIITSLFKFFYKYILFRIKYD